MKRIGLLSDTHGYWDERYARHFAECDEVWHAGDIGSLEVAERFEPFRPFRAVYGNIDGRDIRLRYPEIQRFTQATTMPPSAAPSTISHPRSSSADTPTSSR